MRRLGSTAVLTALLLAGCGTTVPVGQQGAAPAVRLDDQLGQAGATANSGQLPVPTSTVAGQVSSVTGPVPGPGRPIEGSAAVPSQQAIGGNSRVVAPIVVGMVLTDTSNAAALGVSPGNTFTERQLDDALVRAFNKAGGLAGRRIVPVYATTDTGSANWEADFAAACATMTQDNKAAAVLGFVFNYSAAFERCLASHGITHLSTGFNIPDGAELRPYPLHRALDVPTIGRRTLAKLDGALATGVLTSKSKIGVLMDTCAGTPRSFEQVVKPFVQSHQLTISKTVSFDCVNGNADSGNAVAAIQSAVLAFVTAGVDRVIIHGVSEAGPTLLFTSTAESQNYHPQYLVSSLAQMAALGSSIPPGQIKNVHAFGWLPTQDVSPNRYPKRNASQTRCLAMLKSQGLAPSSATDYFGAFEICEAFFLYERALRLAGGTSTGTAVVAALDQLGTSFQSSTNLDGSSHYGPGLLDAVLTARPLDYDQSCSCFLYKGSARAIPQL